MAIKLLVLGGKNHGSHLSFDYLPLEGSGVLFNDEEYIVRYTDNGGSYLVSNEAPGSYVLYSLYSHICV